MFSIASEILQFQWKISLTISMLKILNLFSTKYIIQSLTNIFEKPAILRNVNFSRREFNDAKGAGGGYSQHETFDRY